MEVIHNINITKEKNHMTISIDAENKYNKIEHSFVTNILSKLGTKGIFNFVIFINKNKSSANIKLNGKRLNTCYLKSGTMQSFLFSTVLEFLSRAHDRGWGVGGGTVIGEVAHCSVI